jgi:hypothetical protein
MNYPKKAAGSPLVGNVKIPESTDESTAKTYASTTCPGPDSPTQSKASDSKSSTSHNSAAPPTPSPRKCQQEFKLPNHTSANLTELVCTTKYKKLDPEDSNYNIKPKQGDFSVGDFYEDMPEQDRGLLWIKFLFTLSTSWRNGMTTTLLKFPKPSYIFGCRE